jgi:hypothetical protein
MPIVVEGVSMKEFIYRKYVDALLNIVEDDPDLELIEETSLKIKAVNTLNNSETVFDLSSLQDKNYLIELTSKNN